MEELIAEDKTAHNSRVKKKNKKVVRALNKSTSLKISLPRVVLQSSCSIGWYQILNAEA